MTPKNIPNKQPKKDNKKKSPQDEKIKNESGFFFGKVMAVLALTAGLSSYYIYKRITAIPDRPKLDFDEYWGPYPMKMDPDLSIRPYEIEFSEIMVNDLRERLLHRRPFQPPLNDSGFTYGFNSNFLTGVLDYWQNKYNFREREQFFNKYKHYITNIQGLDVHYMHVKPEVPADVEVVPLLMLHGWPGSVREFYDMIPKLTRLRSERKFVFEVIAPSLPGFGFSQAPTRPGFGPTEMAVVLSNLMKRIGHNEYYVQGGDFGHMLGSILATLMPDEILGFHSNMPVVLLNPLGNIYSILGSVWPSLVTEPELQSRMYPISKHAMRKIEESGYLHIQATKPDTIGIALTDSPAGLAAYILEKFSTWTDNENKIAGDGNLLDKFSLTNLLDNVMVYWATNTITTSMRLYAETMNRRYICMNLDAIPTDVPTWGIKFKHELFYQPDVILQFKYRNYLHSTVVEAGGHFAAMELPQMLVDDIYEAVEEFKMFHNGGKPQEPSNTINDKKPQTVYDFTVRDINGKDVKLDKYKGNVLLIVNVASQCGLTDNNYNQLNELYEKYGNSRDFRILAFPCNQFGGQEPGSSKDINKFVKERNVKFDVFEKIDVNGANTHPLFNFLKQTQGGTFGDFIKWNFSKFIVDKNGIPVERFGSNVNPIDLEPNLAKYW